MAKCSANDCEREVLAKDLCGKHYSRKRLTGSLDAKAQCEAGAGVKFLEALRGFKGEACVRWPYGIGGPDTAP
jgi:hypothetical protein